MSFTSNNEKVWNDLNQLSLKMRKGEIHLNAMLGLILMEFNFNSLIATEQDL